MAKSFEVYINDNVIITYILVLQGFSSIMKIFYTVSGFKTPYNYLKEKEDNAGPFDSDFAEYVQLPEVRQALHVGDTEFKSIGPVYWNLLGDFMKSGKPYLEEVRITIMNSVS